MSLALRLMELPLETFEIYNWKRIQTKKKCILMGETYSST